MTALPTTGSLPSAAGTIGNCDRLSVSRNRLRVEFKGSGVRRGCRLRGKDGHLGINRDLASHQAARSRHPGIDWDRLYSARVRRSYAGIGQDYLCGLVPRRSRADIYGDCLREPTPGWLQGRIGGDGGRGRGEGAP
jgi:hypothetical protein